MNTPMKIDKFTAAYIECALWSSTDNLDDTGGRPLDENFGPEDVHPDTISRMIEDCRQFQEDNRSELDGSDLSLERQGHDFWLNRNGHGSGFWDEGSGPVFAKLSEASKAWGSFDLYIGDDNMIHGN